MTNAKRLADIKGRWTNGRWVGSSGWAKLAQEDNAWLISRVEKLEAALKHIKGT